MSEKVLILDPVSTNNQAVFYQKSTENQLIRTSRIKLFNLTEVKLRNNVASLVNQVEKLFKEAKEELLDLNKIIFCSGPAGFSVLRNTCVFIKTLKIFQPEIQVFKLNLLEIALLYLKEIRRDLDSIALKSKIGFLKAKLPPNKNPEKLKIELLEEIDYSKTLVLEQKFYDDFSLVNFLIELELKDLLSRFLVEEVSEILPDYGKEAV